MKVSVPDRKGQILLEATRLFSENGFDKVTIKELAEACGITEPALYRHFPSKEAIYAAVLDSVEQRLSSSDLFVHLDKENDLEKLLRGLAQHILEFFTSNRDLYRLLLFSALRDHAKAKRVYQVIRGVYVTFLCQQLDRLYEEGIIIKKDNQLTARCFIGMVFDCVLGITLWRGFQGKVYEPEEAMANNIPIYVRGLKA
ncbi:MAG: TetR/AcrR family transcriptional regulator [Candidatus Zixiibacteriota bacterium]|nr:MAG: TetR/AcrR family transcriptional regulator [candidate division Zixibacteria bacterium]